MDKVKYLGMTLELSRPKILKAIQSTIKSKLGSFKARIQLKDPKLKDAIFTSYLRSLIIYHFTPLVAVGLVLPADITKYEASIRK